jgi:hypothetical protein
VLALVSSVGGAAAVEGVEAETTLESDAEEEESWLLSRLRLLLLLLLLMLPISSRASSSPAPVAWPAGPYRRARAVVEEAERGAEAVWLPLPLVVLLPLGVAGGRPRGRLAEV